MIDGKYWDVFEDEIIWFIVGNVVLLNGKWEVY